MLDVVWIIANPDSFHIHRICSSKDAAFRVIAQKYKGELYNSTAKSWWFRCEHPNSAAYQLVVYAHAVKD